MGNVIILSGISGSGKSTLAREMREQMGGIVVSADDFFMDSAGNYNFNPADLTRAHGQCFRRFMGLISAGYNVFVDNTNTTEVEIAPYVLGAQAYGYTPKIVTVMCHGEEQVERAWRRNRHGVPLEGVRAQHRRILARRLPPWWVSEVFESNA